jgi:hypothetical protein
MNDSVYEPDGWNGLNGKRHEPDILLGGSDQLSVLGFFVVFRSTPCHPFNRK